MQARDIQWHLCGHGHNTDRVITKPRPYLAVEFISVVIVDHGKVEVIDRFNKAGRLSLQPGWDPEVLIEILPKLRASAARAETGWVEEGGQYRGGGGGIAWLIAVYPSSMSHYTIGIIIALTAAVSEQVAKHRAQGLPPPRSAGPRSPHPEGTMSEQDACHRHLRRHSLPPRHRWSRSSSPILPRRWAQTLTPLRNKANCGSK